MDKEPENIDIARHRPLLALGCLILMLTPLANAQVRQRGVKENVQQYKNYPLELVSCQSGARPQVRCSEIPGDSNWWRSLTLTLKNVSARTISEFNIELSIERQGKMRLPGRIVLVPDPPIESVKSANGEMSFNFRRRVKPGETFRVKVPEIPSSQLSASLRRTDVVDFDHVALSIQFLFFEDGTRWDFGSYTRILAGQSHDLSQKRVMLRGPLPSNAPIEIVDVSTGGKTVRLDQPFTGDADWLRDFTVTFKNIATRPIRSVSLYLTVLESRPDGPPPGIPMHYGTLSTGRAEDRSKLVFLQPGTTASVRMDPELFEKLRKIMAEREDVSKRTTAQLSIMSVMFADDTLWDSSGRFFRRNQAGVIELDTERIN